MEGNGAGPKVVDSVEMTPGASDSHRHESFGQHPGGVPSTEKNRRYSPPPTRTADAVHHFLRNDRTGNGHYSIGGGAYDHDEDEDEDGGENGGDDGEGDYDDNDDDYVSHLSGSEADP